ncbi:MAG: molecular chaperone TorD family protein [Planctomycetes bacterium]|nr:molecular chaperone TorD family protein [Planctomycetota bacterium]
MKEILNNSSDLEVELALCRGGMYRLLADLLCFPQPSTLSQFEDGDEATVLLEAAELLDRKAKSPELPLAPIVERLAQFARESALKDLDGAYQRLFGHTAHGQVPPYETEYGLEDLFRQSQELADIGGFYNAFGLMVANSIHERQDHISAECEFMAFLAVKEAQALSSGDREAFEVSKGAEKSFLKEHLGRFGRAFARSLQKAAQNKERYLFYQPYLFYQKVADLLFAFLTAECLEFGIPPGPELIRLSRIKEEDVPMACGSVCQLMKGADSTCSE